jgi:hypothetical protein
MKAILYNYDIHLTSYEGNDIQLRCLPHMKAIIYNYDVHFI